MHRAPKKKGNNIARAQFIVPLQFNYNQQIKKYLRYTVLIAFKYFFSFLGSNHNIRKEELTI